MGDPIGTVIPIRGYLNSHGRRSSWGSSMKAWLKASRGGFVKALPDGSTSHAASPTNQFPSISFHKNLAVLALGCLPLVSGCVGDTVNQTLESAALSSPVQLTGESDTSQIDFAGLEAVPVPVRAPRPDELALTQEDISPAEAATGDLLAMATTDTDTGDIMESSTEDDVADDLQGSLNPSPPNQPQPAATRPPESAPAQPKTLFGALFGNRSKPRATAKKPPAPAASIQTARAAASSNALPGVKRDSALFGIGDADDNTRPELIPGDSVQVASVGSFGRFKMVNGLVLQTDKVQVDCFKPELMRILRIVERRYGKKVMVTSGFRSASTNRRAGGARNSTHIYCKAADIQVDGVSKWDLAKFLRTVDGRGGVGTYCRTESVHIDVGSVRDWHHPCRRSKSRVKKKKA